MLTRLRKWTLAAGNRPGRAVPPRTLRLRDALDESGQAADAWAAECRARRSLFVNLTDHDMQILRHRHPEHVGNTIAAADRILRHEFDLLGSGPFTPIDPDRPARSGYVPIDWSLDATTGDRFPAAVPLERWSFDRMRPGLADIKLPWELGRCQHLVTLGQAYRLTSDTRYAHEIVRQIDDFREANPIATAVQWACTMDVAIRGASWALALELVKPCPAIDNDTWFGACESLWDHATFIESHLENTYEVTSNHFLSDVAGWFYVAAAFRGLAAADRWSDVCRDHLEREMTVQVLDDGADYESSVPYHRLVTELFLGAARVAAHQGRPMSAAYLDRLARMADYLAAVQRPDGLMPQIGDADDGRLHVLSEYGTWNPQDARHLLGPAAALLGRREWAAAAGSIAEWETRWWGLEPARDPLPTDARTTFDLFPAAGVGVARIDGDYLVATNGRVGTNGFGNHKHNDQLGFEYHVGGVPLFVDPGSYVYTRDPDARNLFRSTRVHNTLSVDAAEQNDFKREWLFRMFAPERAPELEGAIDGDRATIRGRHYGYHRFGDEVTHERIFEVSAGRLAITDIVSGRGTHDLAWHFHCAPGVDVATGSRPACVCLTSGCTVELRLPDGITATVGDGWYSPSYGRRVRCKVLDATAGVSLDRGPVRWRFELCSVPSQRI